MDTPRPSPRTNRTRRVPHEFPQIAVEFGVSVLVEGVDRDVDLDLDAIIRNRTRVRGGATWVTLFDKEVERRPASKRSDTPG